MKLCLSATDLLLCDPVPNSPYLSRSLAWLAIGEPWSTRHIALIDLEMAKQLCNSGMNPTWSWCIIIIIWYWIWYANIL